MSYETHDTDDWPVLTQHLRYLVHTVAVLREDDHPSSRFRVVGVLFLKVYEMFEDNLLEFRKFRMSNSQ